MNPKLTGHLKFIYLLVGLLIALVCIIMILLGFYANQGTIPRDVTFLGQNMSGMKIDEFRQHLMLRVQQLEQQTIVLKLKSDSKESKSKHEVTNSEQTKNVFTWQQLGLTTDAEKQIQLMESLTQGSLLQRAEKRYQASGTNIQLSIEIDFKAMESAVLNIWGNLQSSKPTNAQRVITSSDQVSYIPGKNVVHMDMNRLHSELTSLSASLVSAGERSFVDERGITAENEPLTLNIPTHIIYPEITVESLLSEGIERKIKEFTTYFRTSGAGRIHNIQSTAKTIHNQIMKPGEIFDYAKVIENTEKQFGFKQAPVILNGKLVKGIGGGICQVSTTLYNAVLRSGLEIVERRNHSLPISYVPLGQDATFASGYINFKFRNSTDSHLLIRIETTDQQITVKLFGSLPEGLSYEVDSEVVKIIEPPITYVRNSQLDHGEQRRIRPGKSGYIVDTYRITKQAGKEIHRERVSRDHYKAKPSLIAANPKDIDKNKLEQPVPKSTPTPKKQIIEDGVLGPVF